MVYATNCQRIFINDYLEKEDELIFILTCGGSLGTGDLAIEKLINPARSKVYELPIKTNYIIFHEMDDEKTIKSKLKKADESLLKIIDDFEIGFLKNEKITERDVWMRFQDPGHLFLYYQIYCAINGIKRK